MIDQDKTDLARFRAKERGELIDNLYRAGLVRDYTNVPQSTPELKIMWSDYITKCQQRLV